MTVPGLASALSALLAQAPAACRCPCAPTAALVVRPSAEAFRLNRTGADLYRQRRFAEARAAYRAAIAADPGFLGPRLNLATAFAQEGNFTESVAEAARLAELGFVPWAREIREAADLAPLAIRPERASLTRSLEAAARAWGTPLAGALLFVARTAPVRLRGAGTFALTLAQEIHAYLPASGRYRQVTHEDGRVLAFVRSPDGRRVVFLRGGDLVRKPGEPVHFERLTVRALDLPAMALGPPLPLPGSAARVGLVFDGPARVSITLVGSDGPTRVFRFDGGALSERPGRAPAPRAAVELSAETGVGAQRAAPDGLPCRLRAQDVRRAGVPAQIEIRATAGSFTVVATDGAGLAGLPLPTD